MPLSYANVSSGGYIVRQNRRSTHCFYLEIVASSLSAPAMDPAMDPAKPLRFASGGTFL